MREGIHDGSVPTVFLYRWGIDGCFRYNELYIYAGLGPVFLLFVWIGLDWIGSDRIGLDWIALDCIGLNWFDLVVYSACLIGLLGYWSGLYTGSNVHKSRSLFAILFIFWPRWTVAGYWRKPWGGGEHIPLNIADPSTQTSLFILSKSET